MLIRIVAPELWMRGLCRIPSLNRVLLTTLGPARLFQCSALNHTRIAFARMQNFWGGTRDEGLDVFESRVPIGNFSIRKFADRRPARVGKPRPAGATLDSSGDHMTIVRVG
jgi:hypothetical protein